MKAEDIKQVVKEKYGIIAEGSLLLKQKGCCGPVNCCGEMEISMIGDDYKNISGYSNEADLGLGCGIPTQFAEIQLGDHVLDLGSGAGNDCFVARSIVGETGKVTGLDFTETMIAKAIENNKKIGYSNVEFVKGDIEDIPLPVGSFDIVLSNCVLNLVPDKKRAFGQIMKVLKQGGHFCVSDVVTQGSMPAKLKEDAEMYAGCVAGAIQKDQYMEIINKAGFIDVEIRKEKQIILPDSLLENYLQEEKLSAFKKSKTGIFSITVYGKKS